MTFTEAAVEVLRRAGKALHFKDIADLAVRENLLSHVGQDPEVTMGQRLAAMAKREEDRKVVAVAPEGTFALTEWSVPSETVIEAKAPPLIPEGAELETPYRGREREPRPIHAQARRRREALLGHEAEEPEVHEAEHHRRERGGQRRFPPPAEVVFEALAQRQSGASLAELVAHLLGKGLLSEALVRDLPSLTAALLEDNRRRTEVGRKPAFIVDGERVTLVEFPPPTAAAEPSERAPQSGLGRPPTSTQLIAEYRRATMRALKRRLADLETAGFEHVCAALLEKMGMRDVRVAKRGKEGPLQLARQRRGVSDLRVAVRLVRGAREITRQDVQDLRKDLAHYSAQMGLLLAPGEAGREARSEASAAGQPPVALYAGEAFADELVVLRVGVAVQTVELADVDEAFFAAANKSVHRPEAEKREAERRDRPPREEREPRGRGADEERDAGSLAGQEQDQNQELAFREPDTNPPEPAEGAPPAPESGITPQELEPRPDGMPASEASAGAEDRPDAEGSPSSAGDRSRRKSGREREAPVTPAVPRLTSPADQAWGQPAGTPRRSFAPFSLDRAEAREGAGTPTEEGGADVASSPDDASSVPGGEGSGDAQ
ncbi:MAG TPA: restriction endonuclease [Myxococcales bacterium]|jgi:ribonuclease E|nr:restriction endonuclease [Myxococcales bacterium]